MRSRGSKNVTRSAASCLFFCNCYFLVFILLSNVSFASDPSACVVVRVQRVRAEGDFSIFGRFLVRRSVIDAGDHSPWVCTMACQITAIDGEAFVPVLQAKISRRASIVLTSWPSSMHQARWMAARTAFMGRYSLNMVGRSLRCG